MHGARRCAKNAEALENLHHIDTVVLDKTGTLTKGKPAVTDIIPNGISEVQLLKIAASLEKNSEHPFAKAILAKAAKLALFEISDFETIPGRGVSGVIRGVRYYGGNEKLMTEHGISVPHYAYLASQGKTPLHFASADGKYLGAIAAADVLKSDSRIAVEAMQKLHLDVVMLTGDNREVAKTIASQAGITHVVSDVEFIAREAIMLKKGVISDSGSPYELTQKIEGQVWQTVVAAEEVQAMQEKFRVVNIQNGEQGVILRILSDVKPTEDSVTVVPSLEDYYLYVFGDIL